MEMYDKIISEIEDLKNEIQELKISLKTLSVALQDYGDFKKDLQEQSQRLAALESKVGMWFWFVPILIAIIQLATKFIGG